MKSPSELKIFLRRQWERAAIREARLLGGSSSGSNTWPLLVSIGRPSARQISNSLDDVKHHIETWRGVSVGEVLWKPVRYRATSSAVDIPVAWKFSKPSQWVEAIGDVAVRQEFQLMSQLVAATPSEFHSLFVRRRSLWSGKPLEEILQASQLAMLATPGCAQGQPLRLISLAGIDTKFFERHASLVTALLDARFDGEVSEIGLENFLGAFREGDHWLLIIDLDGSLLPFKKMRVRSSELKTNPLPGSRLLIVENESCQHHLPDARDTIAVFGTGFDLSWCEAHWLAERKVAYWGDIDTWGLQFLSTARAAIPHLEPLLMSEAAYDEFSAAAVREPVLAGTFIPPCLTKAESALYKRLLRESSSPEPRGRLEQEFLPRSYVQQRIAEWVSVSCP